MDTLWQDVDADGGCTTVVPGSHVLCFDPRDAFTMTKRGEVVGGKQDMLVWIHQVLATQFLQGTLILKHHGVNRRYRWCVRPTGRKRGLERSANLR